ncbi:lysophospholipid acyltransferase family protein [Gemmatimonadota bacterium]
MTAEGSKQERQREEEQTGSSVTGRRKKERRAPRRGRLFRFLFPFTSYLVTCGCVVVFWIYLFVLNRTKIIGRQYVGEAKNTLLLSNHQSMIDSFLVGMGAYFPQALWKPYLLPWNPAAEENFYKTPLLAWFADQWKCIPIRRGRRDFHAVHRMSQVLPHGTMVLFPEGTRSRDGSVRPGRPGVGLVALSTRPRVIPVAIEGMNRALPIGKFLPRIFQRITVSYGPPVDCTEFYEMRRTRETTELLVKKAMAEIRKQYAELQQLSGFSPTP